MSKHAVRLPRAAPVGDLLDGARFHVREALARRLASGSHDGAPAGPSSAAERLVDGFLRGRGLFVARSVIWPEAARVGRAGGGATVGAEAGADEPLERAATLLEGASSHRDSGVQTDAAGLGMDPVAALGEKPQSLRGRSRLTACHRSA